MKITAQCFVALTIIIMNALPLRGEEFVPKFLPTVKALKLETNTANKVKKRVRKCEAAGIEDIRKLTSPFEEFWAYLPGKCSWIELGILEQIRGGIRLDRQGKCRPPSTVSGIRKKDVIALLRETSDIVFYHPHPSNKSIVTYALKNAKAAGREDTLTALCITQASTETLEAALPGIPDLNSLFEFSKIFYPTHPGGHFAERIISVYGITEYRLTRQGKIALNNGDFVRHSRSAMRHYFNVRNGMSERSYRASNSAEINAQKIERHLAKLNLKDGLFYIKFMPF